MDDLPFGQIKCDGVEVDETGNRTGLDRFEPRNIFCARKSWKAQGQQGSQLENYVLAQRGALPGKGAGRGEKKFRIYPS